jgi:rhodanese-related sulfurtransferase
VASTYALITKGYELVISLYWTQPGAAATLVAMHYLTRTPIYHQLRQAFAMVASVLALGLGSLALAAGHEAVSADAAAAALAQGATVVDVRSAAAFEQGHLPCAVRWSLAAVDASAADLAQFVSQAGVDLSRTVLVVGEPGDARAQALWHTLASYASGRVLWLVGGTTEWRMTGRSLSTHTVVAKAVPQHLVLLQALPAQARMAGHSLRTAPAGPESLVSLAK